MKLSRNVAALVLLTALALVGAVVLLALHDPVPEFLTFVVVTGVGALAGVAIPGETLAAAGSTSDEVLPHGSPLPSPDAP